MIRYTTRPDGQPGSILHDLVVHFRYDANSLSNWAFVADTDYEVVAVRMVPTIVGSNGSAVTADVVKASGTTVVGSGVTVLGAANGLDLKGTINTSQSPTLTATIANKRLTVNDRLGIVFGGTLTAAFGIIQINLKRLQSANTTY